MFTFCFFQHYSKSSDFSVLPFHVWLKMRSKNHLSTIDWQMSSIFEASVFRSPSKISLFGISRSYSCSCCVCFFCFCFFSSSRDRTYWMSWPGWWGQWVTKWYVFFLLVFSVQTEFLTSYSLFHACILFGISDNLCPLPKNGPFLFGWIIFHSVYSCCGGRCMFLGQSLG